MTLQASSIDHDGPAGEPVMSLRGISKSFGAVRALDAVDLDIFRGEVVAIVGDNGAGKSTLLKLLSKVTKPTTGKIYTKGRIASHLELGEQQMGFLKGIKQLTEPIKEQKIERLVAQRDGSFLDRLHGSQVRELRY